MGNEAFLPTNVRDILALFALMESARASLLREGPTELRPIGPGGSTCIAPGF